MRRALILAIGLCACDALVTGEPPPSCEKPCPAACVGSCLPTGYCETSVATLAELHLTHPAVAGESQVTLAGLPPDVDVLLAMDATLDFPERAQTVPWRWGFAIAIDRERGVWERSERTGIDFPIPVRWTKAARTDAQGRALLFFEVYACEGPTHVSCVLGDAGTISATVVDPGPWRVAPACE